MLRQIAEILELPYWDVLENLSFAICKRLNEEPHNLNPGVLQNQHGINVGPTIKVNYRPMYLYPTNICTYRPPSKVW